MLEVMEFSLLRQPIDEGPQAGFQKMLKLIELAFAASTKRNLRVQWFVPYDAGLDACWQSGLFFRNRSS